MERVLFFIIMMEHIDSRLLFSKYRKNAKTVLPATAKQQGRLTQTASKTVYFDSQDAYIKKILINHGWKVTSDDKKCTLKWVYQPKHNTYSELNRNAKINHFPHSHLLTTKLGLCKTFNGQRGLIANNKGKSHLLFYPRSYDLSEENDIFVKDYRKTAVLNLLKKIMISIEIHDETFFNYLRKKSALLSKNNKVDTNWVKQLQHLYQTQGLYQSYQSKSSRYKVNSKIFEGLLWYFSLMFTLDCQANQDNCSQQHNNLLVEYSSFDPPYVSLREHFEGDTRLARRPTDTALVFFFRLYEEARKQIKWFRVDGLRNIWVVKANDSSRGRSIVLISSLQELRLLNSGTKLIQKYIQDAWIYRSLSDSQLEEYPFLSKLKNKKFDIRLWVLVRSFAPLQVYIYHQGYLRISKEEYQLLDIHSNSTHLTNFTVNWKSNASQSQSSYVLLSQFTSYLDKQGFKQKDTLMQEINDLVLQTLQTADLTMLNSDNRCFELFGFDVILDSELKPWLLEVNMSPACKQRGQLANELERMGSGLLSLVGLIGSNTYQSGWLSLTGSSKKKSIKKENVNPLTRSQSKLTPVFSRLSSFKQPEELELSRTNSLLPLISAGRSIYDKTESVLNDRADLFLVGNGLGKKQFDRADRFANYRQAVSIIERHYIRIKRQRKRAPGKIFYHNKSLFEKQPPLNFLRLFECLAFISQKQRLKFFKQIKKRTFKRAKNLHLNT